MRLWVESAVETVAAGDTTPADAVSTLTTEEQFVAAVVSGQGAGVKEQGAGGRGQESGVSDHWGQRVIERLGAGGSIDMALDEVFAALPAGEHQSVALLRIQNDGRAAVAEVDAPPLFMARRGRLVLLPVIEEEVHGRLIRRCEFDVRDGDHLAMVSEGYIQASGWDRRFGWRDIAVSIRRLTETRCDAEQLAGALARLANGKLQTANRKWQMANGKSAICDLQFAICILAMFVRPMRTATVWSGPPADRIVEKRIVETLMAEEDMRIVCGDTTAEIAARLMGATLTLEPRPPGGWKEVPPTAKMVGPDGAESVALVTEGVVTMRVARERLAEAKRPRDLAGREDGASRLARLLLTADKVHFIVGLAVNPAQVERDGTPLRKAAVAGLMEELRARGKIVSVEHF